ncbi:MAG: flippase-like domain-containing protein [Planctomycetes bacterium]|nr:flippase-like domain-containing protein [Planctomycetota bacterium]
MLPRKYQRGIAFSVVLTAAIYLGLIVYNGGVEKLASALERFPWWGVPIGCALAAGNWFIRFFKWERYRKLLGVRITLAQSVLIYLSGFALSVTPGKMGEAYKSLLIKRIDGSPISRTAPIVIAERLTDLLGLVILMGASGIATIMGGQRLSGAPEGPDYGRYIGTAALGTLILCIVFLGVVFCDPLVMFIIKIMGRVGWLKKLDDKLVSFHDATKKLLSPSQLLFPTLISVASWSCEAYACYFIANQFSADKPGLDDVPGAAVTLPLCFFAYSFSMIAGNILFLLPAGVGVTEGLLGWLLDHIAGLIQASSISCTLLLRACTLWFAVLVGLISTTLFERWYGRVEENNGEAGGT